MPTEVVFMMDLAGVLTTSPFPAARRLSENMMLCVFERAGTHMINKTQNSSPTALARRYSNFFPTVIEFSEKTRGIKSAFERLELGEINRFLFMDEFSAEIKFMLTALAKQNPEELEAMGILYPARVKTLKHRFPLLADPIIQALILEFMDVEAFLCTLEKISPRKNVLNLLHYLRVKSRQEIRLFGIGNSWEFEGQYRRMAKSLSSSLADAVSSTFPVNCPIEYGQNHKGSFSVNGLFDGYVQSYTYRKRKPYPDIYMQAVNQAMESRMPTGDALRYGLKPSIFYFDDNAQHCEVARDLPGSPFTAVYFIDQGACDVYSDILAALKLVAAKDPFWKTVVDGVEKDIAPLFASPKNLQGGVCSWVDEELHNYNNNVLFIPPPPCDLAVPVNPLEKGLYHLDEEDMDAILYYCAQHLPHLLPLKLPETPRKGMRLWEQPGIATSSGPITFEYIQRSGFFETFRVTLRTGSYILRMQPRGPKPMDSADIKREYETMDHLNDVAPMVRAPHTLLYCDSYAVCGRRFFLRRFTDGEIITNIHQLIQPRIRRPYSQRRKIVNAELIPKLFYRAAIDALAALHDAPLPRFLGLREEQLKRSRSIIHPLRMRIQEALDRCRLAGTKAKSNKFPTNIDIPLIEELGKGLLGRFDQTQLSQPMIPMPERFVVVHGSFDMSALVFTHRSLEGRTKYPPALVATTKFRFSRLDDPLVDVAHLALFNYIPAPEGIYGCHKEIQVLFPTAMGILDGYCNSRGYMRHLDRSRREDIFSVYLAALCLHRATLAVIELELVLRDAIEPQPHLEGRSLAFAESIARRGLELLMKTQASRM